MVWLFLLCLAFGVYWIAKAILRSAFGTGRIIVAPRSAAEVESRSKIWWALGLPLTIIIGILLATFVGMTIWYAIRPGLAPK